MKYIISRTSLWDDNERPYPTATKVYLQKYKDVRTFKNKIEWLKRFPKDSEDAIEWGITKNGEPFRIVNGSHITFWLIDIPDLVELCKEVGNIVLSPPNEQYIDYDNLLKIEIYDSYRE